MKKQCACLIKVALALAFYSHRITRPFQLPAQIAAASTIQALLPPLGLSLYYLDGLDFRPIGLTSARQRFTTQSALAKQIPPSASCITYTLFPISCIVPVFYVNKLKGVTIMFLWSLLFLGAFGCQNNCCCRCSCCNRFR